MNFCHQSWSSTSFSAPRTGQLAAVQAKNLLLGTGLAQQTLAGVRNLADIDKDGRCNTFSLKNFLSISNTGKLNTEEFCVAMHLCEQFQKGEPLPSQLPVRLEKRTTGLQARPPYPKFQLDPTSNAPRCERRWPDRYSWQWDEQWARQPSQL